MQEKPLYTAGGNVNKPLWKSLWGEGVPQKTESGTHTKNQSQLTRGFWIIMPSLLPPSSLFESYYDYLGFPGITLCFKTR